MFDNESGLVKVWVRLVNDTRNIYTRESVPKLSNLQEVVWGILDT